MKLHHVGIALVSIESIERFRRVIDIGSLREHYVPDYDVYCLFHDNIEFIIPASEKSVVHKSIQKRGEGLHHIAFSVHDIVSALGDFSSDELVDLDPRAGAGAMTVAFVRPRTFGGILVELVQEHDSGPRLEGRRPCAAGMQWGRGVET